MATHSEKELVSVLVEATRVDHKGSGVAHFVWTSGTAELYGEAEAVRMAKVILSERPAREGDRMGTGGVGGAAGAADWAMLGARRMKVVLVDGGSSAAHGDVGATLLRLVTVRILGPLASF